MPRIRTCFKSGCSTDISVHIDHINVTISAKHTFSVQNLTENFDLIAGSNRAYYFIPLINRRAVYKNRFIDFSLRSVSLSYN